jgi:hypothetical protein
LYSFSIFLSSVSADERSLRKNASRVPKNLCIRLISGLSGKEHSTKLGFLTHQLMFLIKASQRVLHYPCNWCLIHSNVVLNAKHLRVLRTIRIDYKIARAIFQARKCF